MTSSTRPAFHIEPFVDKGLGNSAYLVASPATGQAVLVDPLRDVDRYLATAERLGLTITHVLETHLHADFVSGARELAARTGAVIAASAGAGLGFDHRPLAEGDRIALGDLALGVLNTPGHTPEHIAYTLQLSAGQAPLALFSGGALIVGGAARTDLISHEMTEPLAHQLYHTIHDRLMALPDAVSVYPTHGAGSFCVAPASSERTSTIGHERHSNPLAQAHSEEEFVQRALDGLPEYPIYYRYLRAVNQRGPRVLGGLPALPALSPDEVQAAQAQGVAVLDVRPKAAFGAGHIPNAYGIAVDAPLVTWAGWVIPFGTPLVLVSEGPRDREKAVRQLLRIGYDDLRGYLEGGLAAWEAAGLPSATVRSITVAELRERLSTEEAPLVLDVRHAAEWEAGHIAGAQHIENGRLPYDLLPLPPDRPIAVHCAHGSRSMIGISILARRGYRDLVQVEGGFEEWEKAGFPVERDSTA